MAGGKRQVMQLGGHCGFRGLNLTAGPWPDQRKVTCRERTLQGFRGWDATGIAMAESAGNDSSVRAARAKGDVPIRLLQWRQRRFRKHELMA